jgi:hypothetical protein
MALTPETLKATTVLAALTEEQLAAIATLSVNDEARVVSSKVNEHFSKLEETVKAASGVAKKDGEKPQEYISRTLVAFKEQATGAEAFKTESEKHKAKIAELETAIKAGAGSDIIAKQLQDSRNELSALRNAFDSEKAAWAGKEKELVGEISNIRVGSEFSKALASLKFKPEYPKEVIETMVSNAKEKVMREYKPDWLNVSGSTALVFRDQTGEIARNKSNALNPYTPEELLKQHLQVVLDTGKTQEGAGTKGEGSAGQKSDPVDLRSAKTQLEADRAIAAALMAKGLTRGSAEFASEQTKLRAENKVSLLPIR